MKDHEEIKTKNRSNYISKQNQKRIQNQNSKPKLNQNNHQLLAKRLKWNWKR